MRKRRQRDRLNESELLELNVSELAATEEEVEDSGGTSKNWAFGCRWFDAEVESILSRQLKIAHDMRNSLVAIERDRREDDRNYIRKHSETYRDIDDKIQEISKGITTLIEQKREKNSAAGRRIKDPVLDPQIDALYDQRKPLYEALRDAAADVRCTDHYKAYQATVDGTRTKDETAQRAKRDGGQIRLRILEVYASLKGMLATPFRSGCYTAAKKPMRSGPPPRFHAWDGTGTLYAQVDKTSYFEMREVPVPPKPPKKGATPTDEAPTTKMVKRLAGRDYTTVDDLLNGNHSGVQLIVPPTPEGGWTRKMLRKRHAILRIRLIDGHLHRNDQEATKKKTIDLPFVYHRDIPSGATIRYILITRKRVGARFRWQIVFTLKRAVGAWRDPRNAMDGMVAIDIGWRAQPDGALRVATWYGSDGAHGVIELPARKRPAGAKFELSWCDRRAKVDGIQSIRDQNRQDTIKSCVQWMTDNGTPDWMLPLTVKKDSPTPTHAQAMQYLGSWRSSSKLWRLYTELKKQPPTEATNVLLDTLSKWSQRERHLQQYQEGLRQNTASSRKKLYEEAAATLASRYSTFVLEGRSENVRPAKKNKTLARKEGEGIDLRVFHANPSASEGDDAVGQQGSDAKKNVSNAALSILLDRLKNRASRIVYVPAAGTSRECSECGSVNHVGASEVYTCSGCGLQINRDLNAAKNILSRGQAKSAQATGVLAPAAFDSTIN